MLPIKRFVIKLQETTSEQAAFESLSAYALKTRPLDVGTVKVLEDGVKKNMPGEAGKKVLFKDNPGYINLKDQQKIDSRTYLVDISEEESHRLEEVLNTRNDQIEEFYEDGTIQFYSPALDPKYETNQKNIFEKLGVPEVWTAGAEGSGIRVGVIDTGVNTNHEDLQTSLYNENQKFGFIISPGSTVMKDDYPFDGHGTPIAGILSARVNKTGVVGIAPGSQVVMFKTNLSADEGFMTDALGAFRIAKGLGIPVMNCSFGVVDTETPACKKFISELNQISTEMILVFAAGNGDDNHIGFDIEKTFLEKLPGVIKVGALTNNDHRETYSNFGKDVVYSYGNLLSTSKKSANAYEMFNGTSCAAPQVAGICALLLGHDPSITPKKMKEIIYESSIPIGSGLRRVNAYEAFQHLTPGTLA